MPDSHHHTVIEERYPEDEHNFRLLFDMYFEKIHCMAIRFIRNGGLAEEAAMDVMFRIWKNRQRINEVENRDAYIFKLAHNTILNTIRAKKQQLFSLESVGENIQPDADSSPLHILFSKELQAVYENAVLALPDKRRKIFIMHREQNLSASEIAGILGISPRTVEHQIGSALHTIRKAMKEYGILVLPLIIQ